METKRTHSEAKQMIKDIASKYSGATLDTARQIFIDLAKEYRYNFNECKAIQSGNVESGSVYSTLKNRAGVCWELSCIYAEILRQIGIDSYIVTALNREGYYKDESVANHQYNAMLIDGKIYTCDLSTAVCYMEVTGDPNLSMTFVEDPSFTLNHLFEFRRLYW